MIVRESEWTRPRADCPYPQWWTATDPQSTEIEVSELVAGFVRALQPEYVVETGSCIGQTAQIIGMALVENGHGRLETLEPDAYRAGEARQRCDGLPVKVIEMESLAFIPAQAVDFAWLDSLTDLRVAEFNLIRPWLHEGSLIGFHDTSPHQGTFGGEVETIPGTRSIRLRTPRGVTFLQLT